jgi:hypothetical protein
MMTKEELLNTVGYFSWSGIDHRFFIQTEVGNFEFSDPQFKGGTNIITRYNGSFRDWSKDKKPWGKGMFSVIEYCGEEVKYEG